MHQANPDKPGFIFFVRSINDPSNRLNILFSVEADQSRKLRGNEEELFSVWHVQSMCKAERICFSILWDCRKLSSDRLEALLIADDVMSLVNGDQCMTDVLLQDAVDRLADIAHQSGLEFTIISVLG